MVFSWSIDGDHETGNTRKRPEGASLIWLLALGLPLRRSSAPPFRDTLYIEQIRVRDFFQAPCHFEQGIRRQQVIMVEQGHNLTAGEIRGGITGPGNTTMAVQVRQPDAHRLFPGVFL